MRDGRKSNHRQGAKEVALLVLAPIGIIFGPPAACLLMLLQIAACK